jgi:hypothetical protein
MHRVCIERGRSSNKRRRIIVGIDFQRKLKQRIERTVFQEFLVLHEQTRPQMLKVLGDVDMNDPKSLKALAAL